MDIKKFVRSFGYALDGLKLSVKIDQNVRFHISFGTVVVVLALFLHVSRLEIIFLLLAIFFVLITEMINTAIEEMTNLIKREHSEEARIAKDVAAAAVLLSAIFATLIGVIVFLPHLLNFL